MLPIITLQLLTDDLALIISGLEAKVSQAKGFFKETPVVLDFTALDNAYPNLELLLEAVKKAGLCPVAARCEEEPYQASLVEAGLTLLQNRPRENSKAESTPKSETKKERHPTRTYNRPVRSGQQLYAKESDLILTAHTSAGSEIIADGNIHVYGALRGRALGGVNGNTDARIFCQKFEAELVAIAGHYKLIDDTPQELRGKAVQIWLENDILKIEALTT